MIKLTFFFLDKYKLLELWDWNNKKIIALFF